MEQSKYPFPSIRRKNERILLIASIFGITLQQVAEKPTTSNRRRLQLFRGERSGCRLAPYGLRREVFHFPRRPIYAIAFAVRTAT